MRQGRIFTWIWRVNSLIILFAGVLALASVLFALGFSVRDRLVSHQVEDVAKIRPPSAGKTELKLSQFTPVAGTSVLVAALEAQQDYRASFSSKEASSTRNHLFYDTATHEFYWLKPGNEALIIESQSLPAQAYTTTVKPATAVVYTLVSKDTNQDGRLTSQDHQDIALADPNGKRFRVVLSQVESLKGFSLVAPHRVVMLYMSQSQLQAADIDLASQKVLQRYPFLAGIPAVP
jgi:hypothetical protein